MIDYSKIHIKEIENEGKFLMIYEDRYAYIGNLIAQIISDLKINKSNEEILTSINNKYSINLEKEELNKIINEDIYKVLTRKKNKSSVIKVITLMTVSEQALEKLDVITSRYFYIVFSAFLAINTMMYFYFKINFKSSLLSLNETILFYLFLCLIFIIHEIGHLISAKKFGIISKEINFGIYLILPVFYTNLTEIWKLNKKERIIINLSGIYLQFFVGILLFIFFTLTKNQILLHLFYSNFIISIINLNPILKFDGYWVLSDFLEKSNLIKESNDYFKSLVKLKKNSSDFKVKIYTIIRYGFLFYIYFHIL